MMSSEPDMNRGALLLPATEARRHKSSSSNRKEPSGSQQWLPTNSTQADGDGRSEDDILDELTPNLRDGGHREQNTLPYSHRHNRIQFRQTIEQQRRLALAEDQMPVLRKPPQSIPSSEPINAAQAAATSSNINKAYMSVKQTALNSFTYKLRLTVAQMQADDYGQYSCISTNPLGSSEAHVIVTSKYATSPVERFRPLSDIHSTFRAKS